MSYKYVFVQLVFSQIDYLIFCLRNVFTIFLVFRSFSIEIEFFLQIIKFFFLDRNCCYSKKIYMYFCLCLFSLQYYFLLFAGHILQFLHISSRITVFLNKSNFFCNFSRFRKKHLFDRKKNTFVYSGKCYLLISFYV